MKPKTLYGALSLLASLALLVSGASAQGAELAHPKRVVDVVFIADCSGSMKQEMSSIREGIFTYVINANAQPTLDVRYAIILLGRRPEMIQDFADAETTLSTFDCLRNVRGFHRRHADREPGLEAIRMVLGGAVMNQFDIEHCLRNGGCTRSDGFVHFRRDADAKIVVLLTDEDSDLPMYRVNRMPGQKGLHPPKPHKPRYAAWQEEIDVTARLIASDPKVMVNLLINPSRGKSVAQYGDPTADCCVGPGLLGYEPADTLAALRSGTSGAENCLQERVLARGGFARTFDITRLEEPGRCDLVFLAKFEELAPGCLPCTGWRNFGAGTPAGNGDVPTLTVREVPALGRGFVFMVGNPTGVPTAGLMLISTDRFYPPLDLFGGTIYPNFLVPTHAFFPVPLPGAMSGYLVHVPREIAGLPCFLVYAQVAVVDFAPLPTQRTSWPLLAFSEGLELAIGRE